MSGDALNSDAVKNRQSTRRSKGSKRKVDDLEKGSPGTSKKRQSTKVSNNSVKPPRPQTKPKASSPCLPPAKKSSRIAKRDQGKRKKGNSSTQSLSKKQQEEVMELLGKANVDSNLLSSIESQIQRPDDDALPSEDDESDIDKHSSPKLSAPSRVVTDSAKRKRTRLSSSRSLKDNVINEDENDQEEDDVGEFQRDLLQDIEDNEKLDDDGDEDAPLQQCESDDVHPAPVLEESEEEQEVSINMNTHLQIPQPQEDGTIVPVPTPDKDIDPSQPDTFPPQRGTFQPRQRPEADPRLDERDTLQHANNTIPITGTASVDDSVLMNTIAVMQRSIMSSMEAFSAQMMAEIQAERQETKRLREHVTELATIVTTTAVAMFNKHPSSNPRVKEIQRKLCLLPALFNDSFMLKIFPRVVIGFIVNNIDEQQPFRNLEENGVQYLCVLNFSRKPKETKKEKFSSEVGRIYSKFRY